MSKYTVGDVKMALNEIANGSTVAEAARKYKIPRTTLSSKHHNIYPVDTRKGPESVLTHEEEMQLEKWILHIGDMGFPPNKRQLLDSVQRLIKTLNKETPFTNGRPGRKWYRAFLRRHPKIVEKMAQNLSKRRSMVTEENIRKWFDDIRGYLEKNNLLDVLNEPDRVFNMDESAFFLSPVPGKVLARKSEKSVYTFINNDEKECLTALVGGNASGKITPTMVLYPYQRLPLQITETFPEDWALGRSETGWMTAETFFEYIANVFRPWLIKEKIQLPVILFVDGHASHVTLHLSEFCNENGIILIGLFPNSTHIYQPMDRSVFRTLKVGWKKGVEDKRVSLKNDRFKREHFAPLLKKVIDEDIKASVITNGFRKCGLYPYTADAINFKDLIKNIQTESDHHDTPKPPEETNISLTAEPDMSPEAIVNYLERTLDTYLVSEFHLSGSEWKGEEKHFSLFNFWKNHVDMVHAHRTPVNEIVLDLDNVQLIDGADFDLLIGSINLEEDNDEEGTTINVVTSEIATLSLDLNENCATFTPEADIDDEEGTAINVVTSEVATLSLDLNENCATFTPEADIDHQQPMQTEDVNENYVTVSPVTENPLDDNNESSDLLHGIAEVAELMQEVSSYETGSTSTQNNMDNSIQNMIHPEETDNPSHIPPNEPLNIPSGISKPFQDTLFWPLPTKKKASKSKKEKENLPSVLSSPEYISYLKRKQKEKEDFENGKAERKRMRIEKKQQREVEKEEKQKMTECKKAERKRKLDELNAEKEEKKKLTENKKAEKKRKLDELSAKKLERKIAKQTAEKDLRKTKKNKRTASVLQDMDEIYGKMLTEYLNKGYWFN